MLEDLFGERLAFMELPPRAVRGFGPTVRALRGHIDGLDAGTVADALRRIAAHGSDLLVLDGSNLGLLAAAARRAFPALRICTLLHNVEARFFLGRLRRRPGPRAAAVLVANYVAERNAVHASDVLVCLSDRDSRMLQRFYGRAATHVSPIALRDRWSHGRPRPAGAPPGDFALFVGGLFYANQDGVTWFADRVAPRLQVPTVVVGKGFEALRGRLERNGRVKVVGEVDDVAPWYEAARLVVAPIFDGSGMKTKVAEALMFGKHVVGTPEAFIGYGDDARLAGRTCSTADEFVKAIEASDAWAKPFEPRLRALYERRYSYDAAKARYAEILGGRQATVFAGQVTA